MGRSCNGGYVMDKRPLQKHSKLPKSPRIQVFESLEAFKMYYAIGTSVSSLHIHRELSDTKVFELLKLTSCISMF